MIWSHTSCLPGADLVLLLMQKWQLAEWLAKGRESVWLKQLFILPLSVSSAFSCSLGSGLWLKAKLKLRKKGESHLSGNYLFLVFEMQHKWLLIVSQCPWDLCGIGVKWEKGTRMCKFSRLQKRDRRCRSKLSLQEWKIVEELHLWEALNLTVLSDTFISSREGKMGLWGELQGIWKLDKFIINS